MKKQDTELHRHFDLSHTIKTVTTCIYACNAQEKVWVGK